MCVLCVVVVVESALLKSVGRRERTNLLDGDNLVPVILVLARMLPVVHRCDL